MSIVCALLLHVCAQPLPPNFKKHVWVDLETCNFQRGARMSNTWQYLHAKSKHQKHISLDISNVIGTTFFSVFLSNACHLKNCFPVSSFFQFSSTFQLEITNQPELRSTTSLYMSTKNHKINQDHWQMFFSIFQLEIIKPTRIKVN